MAGPIQKVMVAIAGAETSILTAKYAICLAKALGSELIIIYVVDMKALEDLLKAKVFVKVEELEYEKELTEQGERYLSRIEKLAVDKNVRVTKILAKGVVHEEVINVIKKSKVDMLVMGALTEIHSRKDVFYDEAERMFREVKCPVVIAKGDDQIETLYEQI